MEKVNFVPITYINLVHTSPTNLGSWSDSNRLGKPCTRTWVKKAAANDSVSVVSPNGMSISILEKRQTTTKIVDFPSNVGKLVRKPNDASVQGAAGISIDYNNPGVLVFATFVH